MLAYFAYIYLYDLLLFRTLDNSVRYANEVLFCLAVAVAFCFDWKPVNHCIVLYWMIPFRVLGLHPKRKFPFLLMFALDLPETATTCS